MANVSIDVILEMFFLTLSNADIDFLKKSFDRYFISLKKLFLTLSESS